MSCEEEQLCEIFLLSPEYIQNELDLQTFKQIKLIMYPYEQIPMAEFSETVLTQHATMQKELKEMVKQSNTRLYTLCNIINEIDYIQTWWTEKLMYKIILKDAIATAIKIEQKYKIKLPLKCVLNICDKLGYYTSHLCYHTAIKHKSVVGKQLVWNDKHISALRELKKQYDNVQSKDYYNILSNTSEKDFDNKYSTENKIHARLIVNAENIFRIDMYVSIICMFCVLCMFGSLYIW